MRGAWATIIMLVALIVACVAGVLSWFGGANPPNAVIAAGTAFCGLTSFGSTVFDFLIGDQPRCRSAGRGPSTVKSFEDRP